VIYSVWNQGAGRFDYFEDGVPNAKANAPKPSHLVSRELGSTVDQAAWPLPAGARRTGSGSVAIGRVATRKSAAALGDFVLSDSPLIKAGLLLFAGALLVKFVVPKPRSVR
jgi:hypothetical protein